MRLMAKRTTSTNELESVYLVRGVGGETGERQGRGKGETGERKE